MSPHPQPRRPIPKLLFVMAAGALAFGAALTTLFAADWWLHRRTERSAGLNMRGYRGPIVPRRHPGQWRVAVLGGSTVFGYGVTWDQAFPAALERALDIAAANQSWSVVNLGYNNEGAYSFQFTLQDFDYLKPDVVILYEGYNDIIGDRKPNTSLFRHSSPVFVLTGYMPILPLVLHEKAMALRSGGNLQSAYAHEQASKMVFHPSLTERVAASTLDSAVLLEQSIERPLRPLSRGPDQGVSAPGQVGCATPWGHYCDSVAKAVDSALSRQEKVIVAGQPRMAVVGARQEEQQRALAAMLWRRYGVRPEVQYVDLGHAVDPSDRSISPDGMHLNARGNRRLAEQLVAPVLNLVTNRR